MIDQNKLRTLPFPPLTHPPHWADAPLPDRLELRLLQTMVAGTLSTLEQLQLILNMTPAPSSRRLARIDLARMPISEVLFALEHMIYPPSLTDWLDDARRLARQVANNFKDCQCSIGQILRLPTQTPAYHRYLISARDLNGRSYQQCQSLHQHIASLALNDYDIQ